MKRRRAVRSYKPIDVPDIVIERIVDSARYAPAIWGRQPWEFIVVKNPELKKQIIEAIEGDIVWLKNVPTFIVVCVNKKVASSFFGEKGEKLLGIQCAAMALENMLLMAESLGLGTAWIEVFSQERVSIILECPEWIVPVAIVTLGYPKEKLPSPQRHPFWEVTYRDTYSTKWREIG
jgi:nitroreductase